MVVRVQAGQIAGDVTIIPSKSHLHRLLIAAALADGETLLRSGKTEAEDVEATIACLQALGAEVDRVADGFQVKPIDRTKLPKSAILPVRESGSTLRFMLPIVCALGVQGEFHMAGRLPERPMEPLDRELTQKGIRLWKKSPNILCTEGQLESGAFELPGDISSQYITGLLLALPLLAGDSHLTVHEPIESEDYIEMTLEVLETFGGLPEKRGNRYQIKGGETFRSPGAALVEGDWSNAAFWLVAGVMPGGNIRLGGLNPESKQGDKEACAILRRMGANVTWEDGIITVTEGVRRSTEIDAAGVPDLIPVLSAIAAICEGTTIVRNAARLRIKESDRLTATAQTLNALGAKVKELPDGLEITGVPRLVGGTVDSWGDHRIAMTAAIASAACDNPVTITGAEAVRKSYPQFWRELERLGKHLTIEE